MARIHHVTVTVPSEELLGAVEEFYVLLGGVPLRRPPSFEEDTPGRWLGFGDQQVHLILGDPVTTGAHFALHLADEFDGVAAALDARAVPVRRPARVRWDARRMFVNDPAGNLIELFDRAPESAPVASPTGQQGQ